MRMTTRAAALAAGMLVLTACTAEPEPSGSPSTSPTASAAPTTSAPPSPSVTAPLSPSPTATTTPRAFSLDDVTSADFPDLGPQLGPVGEVRVGRHPGYDRVVWEFPGSDTPNYRVRYVDEPRGDGSGDPVEVAGDAYLEVLVTTLSYPESPDDCPDAASRAARAGTVFAEVGAFCGGFEGMGQAFVGLDEERPFRVAVLQNPTRLVVDVQKG